MTYSFIHTNIRVFYHIAQEAYVAMDKDPNSSRRPKPNDEPGWIITYDPAQRSFKNAFITIVFCEHLLVLIDLAIAYYKSKNLKWPG